MWIVWLFAVVLIMTPLGGRIWCLACPLPVFGEFLQRRTLIAVRPGHTGPYGNRFFGLMRKWPKWLSGAWIRTLGFLTLGVFSTALVANPRVSAWVVIVLLAVPVVMGLVWELRAFCRYVCPVSAFVGPYGKTGKLALRAADPKVCERCQLRTCQKGNEKGWACPYGLCVGDMNENDDCGLCTECVKSCAYDNVTLRWRPFAHETTMQTMGEAFQVMAMLTLALAYCVVHLGHWSWIRDYVNILDKGNWDLFAIYAAVLCGAALGGVPAVMCVVSVLGKWFAKLRIRSSRVLVASTGALVPMGLLLWAAFVLPILLVNVSFVLQSMSDPFGWGWDFFGTRSTPWHQLWPRAIPWMQVACVLLGLTYSLRNGWRIWFSLTEVPRRAFVGMLPLSALLLVFSTWLCCFFAS